MSQRKGKTTAVVEKPQQPKLHGKDISEIDRLVGPVGAAFLLVVLPFALQAAWFLCDRYQCKEIGLYEYFLDSTHNVSTLLHDLFPMPNEYAIKWFAGWTIIQWIAHFVVPGEMFLGYPLSHDQSRAYYKINGMTCFILTLIAFVAGTASGYFDPRDVVANFGPLAVTSQIFSIAASILMYLKGIITKRGNPSGNVILDYFYGYEPNPRLFGAVAGDCKFFMETRALYCWIILDLSLAYTQYQELGRVTNALVLIVGFHFAYVFHNFIKESFLLTMIDFTAENMGWMLTWGNVSWVGFVFCIPSWYGYRNPQDHSLLVCALLVGFHLLGIYIFSSANHQKNSFKADPNKPIWGKKPQAIVTDDGRKLLISGWWGLARKMNYLGDLIVALSFSLPTLSIGIVPYLYFLYLFVLLIHRQERDEQWCKSKYGPYWDEYCKVARYRIVPYIY